MLESHISFSGGVELLNTYFDKVQTRKRSRNYLMLLERAESGLTVTGYHRDKSELLEIIKNDRVQLKLSKLRKKEGRNRESTKAIFSLRTVFDSSYQTQMMYFEDPSISIA